MIDNLTAGQTQKRASDRPVRNGGLSASRWRSAVIGAIIPIVILAAWNTVTVTGLVPAFRLPSPADVVIAGIDLTESGRYATYIAISLQRVFLGFAIGSLVGLVLGAVVGLSRVGSWLLSPTMGGIRAVPSLAWVPLLILYVGTNEDSKVVLVAIGALFPVYTTVATALRHVDPHLVEVGRALGRSGISLLTTVQLPAVVPSIVAGLRLALAQAWLFLVAAELIASSMGLGFLLGKVTDALIGLLERALLKRWG